MRSHILASFLVACALFASPAYGQKIAAGLSSAKFQCGERAALVQASFDKSLHGLIADAEEARDRAPADERPDHNEKLRALKSNIGALYAQPQGAGDFRNVYLLELGSGGTFRLVPTTPAPGNSEPPDVLEFAPADRFDPGAGKFALIVQGVTEKPSMAVLSVPDACLAVKDKLPAATSAKDLEKPHRRFSEYTEPVTGRDEAVVFVDFAFDARKNTKDEDDNFYFTGDGSFVPVRIRRLGLGGAYELQPFFLDVKINSGDKQRIYTSEYGIRAKYIRVFGDDGRGYSNQEHRRKLIPGITAESAIKVEMDKWFQTVNLVSETRAGLPLNLKQSRARSLRIEPYFGFAFGKNLRRKEDKDPERAVAFDGRDWIARPFAGAELLYSDFRDRYIKPSLSVSYVRRWPLAPEVFYLRDANDKKFLGGTSRVVRDYVKARIDLDFGGIIKPFLSYEWGRNPPGYELINSNFKTGLSVKFKGKDR
jgi:hypothetical protein